jgi:hypothetical protein
MIKSLTPFCINVPFVDVATGITCQKYTLKVYVWDGLKTATPATATYEITKFNPTASTGTDKINIARLVNDFIDFDANAVTITELVDGNNQKWVQTEIYYDDSVIPRNQTIQLLLRGYGYGMEGENPQPPTNKILIPIQDYKVNREGVFVVPILIDEPAVTGLVITITLVTEVSVGDEYQITFTTNRVATSDITVYYRETDDPDWNLYADTVTSPYNLIVAPPLTGGDYEFRLSLFDLLQGEVVYSNVYNLIP